MVGQRREPIWISIQASGLMPSTSREHHKGCAALVSCFASLECQEILKALQIEMTFGCAAHKETFNA
jgi:hypothetical protein